MKKNMAKIILDIMMTILLIVLMNVAGTGVLWHEMLGVFLFGLFIIHCGYNWNWIKGVTKTFFKTILKPKTKIIYALNGLLLVFMAMTGLSGILISQYLFTYLNTGNITLWSALHTSFAYGSFIIASIHLGMHWKYVMEAFRKMFSIGRESKLRTIVLRSLAVLLVLVGIKNSFAVNMPEKLLSPLTVRTQGYGTTMDNTLQTTEVYTKKLSTNIMLLSASTSSSGDITLEDYLGSLHCTACHKNCPLLSPRCMRGVDQAQQAETTYNAAVTATQSESNVQSDSDSITTTDNSDNITNSSSDTSDNTQAASAPNSDTAVSEGNATSDSITTNDSPVASNNYASATNLAPIMSVYAAGAYYTLTFLDKKKT